MDRLGPMFGPHTSVNAMPGQGKPRLGTAAVSTTSRTEQHWTALDCTELDCTAQNRTRVAEYVAGCPKRTTITTIAITTTTTHHTNGVTPPISNPAKKTRGMIRPVSQPAQTTPHHTRPTGRVERGDLPYLPTLLENPEGVKRVVSCRTATRLEGGCPRSKPPMRCGALRCGALRALGCHADSNTDSFHTQVGTTLSAPRWYFRSLATSY